MVGVLMPAEFVLPVLVVVWIWPAASVGALTAIVLGVGLGAMAPTALFVAGFGRDLPPGRHALETAMLPKSENEEAGAKPAWYRIPFWE